ncbi:hypothetical protein NTHI1209_01096 [Haemophilus influenzae]|uniref:Uncharacterized protein n=1 Tax=Haemophilus influenzae TaxID=727 RepID=A0A158SX95_HAEIF|nr:hypothetical protein NTHI1209_01096 [Haemophilus influenzae]
MVFIFCQFEKTNKKMRSKNHKNYDRTLICTPKPRHLI